MPRIKNILYCSKTVGERLPFAANQKQGWPGCASVRGVASSIFVLIRRGRCIRPPKHPPQSDAAIPTLISPHPAKQVAGDCT